MSNTKPSNSYSVYTAIAYVNAPPHIGHAFEFLAADVLARHHRSLGETVLFSTGTDEHGTKVQRSAEKAGKDPKTFTDEIAETFKRLTKVLGLSEDVFIRTTEPHHIKVAQEVWRRADAAGDIYKKKYEGLYCVGCEAFLQPNEIGPDSKCCVHGVKPELIEEENYFFKLSKYGLWLLKHLEANKDFVRPQGRYNEIKSLIESGLEDVSISRPKEKLSWGVPVPGDDDHVMYVWFDALTNYLSASGFLADEKKFDQFWPASVQVLGQDILRFHAALWPAMLKSAGLDIPKQFYSHGFITNEGHKMSKSVGNVVDPFELVDKYGADAVRYYLLAEIPFGDGGDFSEKRLVERYNSELGNNIGNLVARVLHMTHSFIEGVVPAGTEVLPKFEAEAMSFFDAYDKAMSKLSFHEALAAVIKLANLGNQVVDNHKPWELAKDKTKEAELKSTLYTLQHVVLLVAAHLLPFMPESAAKILSAFDQEGILLHDVRKLRLKDGQLLGEKQIIFPRKDA